jgi:hypothetical protein
MPKKIKRVIVLKNGSMKTFTGKPATWSRIDKNARFFHEKKLTRKG